MLAFGIGQAAEGIKNQAFNVFLLFYYQQLVGVSGTLTGLALGIALVFDAVTRFSKGLTDAIGLCQRGFAAAHR